MFGKCLCASVAKVWSGRLLSAFAMAEEILRKMKENNAKVRRLSHKDPSKASPLTIVGEIKGSCPPSTARKKFFEEAKEEAEKRKETPHPAKIKGKVFGSHPANDVKFTDGAKRANTRQGK